MEITTTTQQPELTPETMPRCQTCKHWSRRLSQRFSAAFEDFISIPTKFGYCSSKKLYRDATDMQVSTSDGQDLYTDTEELFDMEALQVDFLTIENFGCVLHEADDTPTPPAA